MQHSFWSYTQGMSTYKKVKQKYEQVVLKKSIYILHVFYRCTSFNMKHEVPKP